ncbi:glycosyltransferase [Synechocystis sp. FACHB-383]|uniref:glycosyltransferase n=1 Tax=Synechocystis sp. FACHB-383 TaxID=2692864 RepID=UPI0016895ABD|nr:glycosyltransferase [Synechocystis sp. FACHB-383]MBD2653507.1 glycosyltransferase [Synechocystis sp. FACHB-383]
MHKLYFLLPGLGGKFACGGLWAELKTIKLVQEICPATIVTYKQREPNTLFLDDILAQGNLGRVIFVISWGFDIPKLAKKLQGYRVIYHAHSTGYGFNLPTALPIVCISRNTMGYWGQRSPHSLLYYLPNHISEDFSDLGLTRDTDVLVQARKSSHYLLKQLIPALQSQCNVKVIDSYVEDLTGMFNRAKVYLYDSAEYWAQQGVSEGFGLQPMEAMACGCHVFSSVNGGLSDYLDPGFNCEKIAGYALDYDCQRILGVVNGSRQWRRVDPRLLAEYRRENILERLRIILLDINEFFDCDPSFSQTIEPLTQRRVTWLKFKSLLTKVKNKFKPN